MALRLVTIARRLTADEADLARLALDNEGIACYFEGETAGSFLWHLNVATGGVKLQVADDDAERAREILAAGLSPPAPTDAPANCGQCGARSEAGFDTCWSCGASLLEAEDANADRQHPAEDDAAEATDLATERVDAAARRAFRAAVVGVFLLPPLVTLYSLWILLRLSLRPDPLGPQATRYIRAAWAINWVAAAIDALLLSTLIR